MTLMKNISSQNILLADQYIFQGTGVTPLGSASVLCNPNVVDRMCIEQMILHSAPRLLRGQAEHGKRLYFLLHLKDVLELTTIV